MLDRRVRAVRRSDGGVADARSGPAGRRAVGAVATARSRRRPALLLRALRRRPHALDPAPLPRPCPPTRWVLRTRSAAAARLSVIPRGLARLDVVHVAPPCDVGRGHHTT